MSPEHRRQLLRPQVVLQGFPIPAGGQDIAGAMLPGLLGSIIGQLGQAGGLIPDYEQPPVGPTPARPDQPQRGQPAGMLPVLQAIMEQVVGTMFGGAGPAGSGPDGAQPGGSERTISEFLESLPDHDYVEGQDMVTDLLMTLARTLTFRHLIGLVVGSREVAGHLREPLRAFMRQRLLDDQDEPNDQDAIRAALVRLLDDHHGFMEAAAGIADVRGDVDYAETLQNFLAPRLAELAELVWNTSQSPDEFGSAFFDHGRRFVSDLAKLSIACFRDGQASMERIVQSNLARMNEDAGAAVSSWAVATAMTHLRGYLDDLDNGDDGVSVVDRYVVRTTGDQARQLREARRRRIEARQPGAAAASASADGDEEAEAGDDEPFETPRSSPELMDTSDLVNNAAVASTSASAAMVGRTRQGAEASAAAAAANTVGVNVDEIMKPENFANGGGEGAAATLPQLRFPEELLPRPGMGPDMVVGRESWHREVAPDWVPIISRDIRIQQGLSLDSAASALPAPAGGSPSVPFSDAYLSTQPAKKRRISEAMKPKGSLDKVVSDTLRDAVRVSGVQPNGPLNSVSEEVAASPALQAAVKNDTRSAIKRRIEEDPDFRADHFPQSKNFQSKE